MNIQDVIAAQGQSMSIQQLQEMLAKAQAQQAPVPAVVAPATTAEPAPAPSIETVIAAATVQPTTPVVESPAVTAKPEPQYNAEGVRLPAKKAPRTRRTKAELEAAALAGVTPEKLLCACASGGVSPADAERYLAILEGLSDA